MRKNLVFALALLVLFNTGVASAHGAIYKMQQIGEHTARITLTLDGDSSGRGVEIRSYTVRDGGKTLNVNYGASKDGRTSDNMTMDTRTVIFPTRIVLTDVDRPDVPVFHDIKGIKPEIYIRHLHDAGIIHGRPDGMFCPADPITRAEFVTIITNALGIEPENPSGETDFKDIANHWAKGRIIAAARKGMIKGMLDGSFKPDDFISVGEVSAILSRAYPANKVRQETYSRLNPAHWAFVHVKAMFDAGILTRDDDIYEAFSEGNRISRADCAMMVSRALTVDG